MELDGKGKNIRKAVLEAATVAFEADGCKKSTLQSIADRAQVDVATIRNLFGNKELLVLAVQSQEVERLTRDYFANMPDVGVAESVAFIIRSRLEFIEKNEERTRFFFAKALLGRQPWSRTLDHMVFQLSVEFAALFEKGVREGDIRKDVDVNIAVRSLTSFYLTGVVSMGLRTKKFDADTVWKFIKPQVDLLIAELT